ncbi:MAG: hypothetical protein ACK4GT_00015 [Pararhodobacter sp.]
MMALLASRVGLAGGVVLAALLFWEGLPGARDAAFMRVLPVAGPAIHDIALGRVGRAERAARIAGALQERGAWEEANHKLRQQMERERRQAQAEIDRIERDYLATRTEDQLRWHAALEAAITIHMESEDARDDSCPVRPAIPRGLSRELGAIGR